MVWNDSAQIKLSEAAGIGTTITDFTIDGQSYAPQIFNWFGQANVPLSGRLMAVLRAKDVDQGFSA